MCTVPVTVVVASASTVGAVGVNSLVIAMPNWVIVLSKVNTKVV